jgi:cytochrome o ubiquinol oxidase subunit IV
MKEQTKHQHTLTLRIVGFLVSLLLTIVAYFMIVSPALFSVETRGAVLAILILALLQSVVQSIFFLDLGREKKPYWNLVVFISTISIIFIIVAFSIWIMHHLNYNMMPMP